jgi:Na+-translocating ferredoxin:NAD+ oxidoreductase RnfD subunit
MECLGPTYVQSVILRMSPRTAQMNLTLREDKRTSKEAGEFKLFLTSMSRISVFDDFWIKATGLAQFHIHTQPQKTTRAS